MAAVLGHETGHVTARHSQSDEQGARLRNSPRARLGPLAVVASARAGRQRRLQVLFLKYSRDDETQADALGFRYMTKVGYDPSQMIPLFEMLDRVSKQGGGGKTPEWLQTHPDPGNRLAETEKRLKTEVKGPTQGMKVEREKYLKMIDGIAFGADPRQGFFKGRHLLPPGAEVPVEGPFRLAAPEHGPGGGGGQPQAGRHHPAPVRRQAVAGRGSAEDLLAAGDPGGSPRRAGREGARTFVAQTQQGNVKA